MDKTELRARYDQHQRIKIEYPDTRREATSDVVRHVDSSALGQGFVLYSQLTEENADAVIQEQITYFESIGQDFEWKLYDYDQPADLKDRLASHGFTVGEAEAIMAIDLDSAPDIFWQTVTHDIRKIGLDKLGDVRAIEEKVWEEDFSGLVAYLEEMLTGYPEKMSVYVAYVDDQPVSSAWILFTPNSQFASLWGGSTLSEFRKKGFYTALLATRAQEARERGVKFLTVDASPMSRPILEKYAFKVIALSYPCRWTVKSQE